MKWEIKRGELLRVASAQMNAINEESKRTEVCASEEEGSLDGLDVGETRMVVLQQTYPGREKGKWKDVGRSGWAWMVWDKSSVDDREDGFCVVCVGVYTCASE